jgi:hypothetical protein
MRKFLFALLLLSLTQYSKSQHFEMGVNLGLANYFGDIAPSPVLSESHMAYGAFARINLSSSFAFNTLITTGTISGDDKNSDATRVRNINFNTPITEYAAWVEFNFFKFGVDVTDKRHSPYVFLGLALTQFDPATRFDGKNIKLRNIRTEDVSYESSTVSIPFGIGYKWQFHKHFAMDWALGFRRSNSDYLDDVSTVYPDFQDVLKRKGALAAELSDPSRPLNGGLPLSDKGYRRGNPDYTDWYIFSTVSLSYRFYKNVRCRRFY